MKIVLLRGLGRDSLHWSPLVGQIKMLDPEVTIVTPDLPGCGKFYKMKSPVTLDAYIQFLDLQIADSKEPMVLVGLSFGGIIALRWLEVAPNKWHKVIAINASCRKSPFYQRLKAYKAFRYPAAVFRLNRKKKERAIYQLTCNTRPVDEKTVNEWTRISQQHPVSLVNQLRQIIAAYLFDVTFVDVKVPLKILYSESDRIVDPRCSKTLIQLFNAECTYHSWAGHDLTQDDPIWSAKEIMDFITK